MHVSAVAFPYWFDQPSERESADRAYVLRGLDDNASSHAHRAPLGELDRALIQRIQAGELSAFEELYRAHADGLIGFAVRLCGSRDVAQDVVEDLFVHLWERRTTWQPQSTLRAYLYAAVRHRVADHARAEHRARARAERAIQDPSLTTPPASVQGSLELSEQFAAVWRIVDAFPPLRRQIMYLRWVREFSPEEIAAAVGLSRNAVDQHLSRAIRAIRDAVLASSRDG